MRLDFAFSISCALHSFLRSFWIYEPISDKSNRTSQSVYLDVYFHCQHPVFRNRAGTIPKEGRYYSEMMLAVLRSEVLGLLHASAAKVV